MDGVHPWLTNTRQPCRASFTKEEITVTKDAAHERALKSAERKWSFVGTQFYRVHEREIEKK